MIYDLTLGMTILFIAVILSNMLSLYPDLYNYAGFIPVAFRLFLGYFLFRTAIENFIISKETGLGLSVILWSGIPLIGGIFLI